MQIDLNNKLLKYLENIFQKEVSDIKLTRFAATYNSDIYLAHCLNVDKKVLVKHVLSDDYEEQLNALKDLSVRMSGLCLTPEYLGCLDGDKVIFMEYIEGNDFYSLLLSRRSKSNKIDLALKAGQWLACYHNELSAGKNTITLQDKLDDLNDYIIGEGNCFYNNKLLRSCMDWLEKYRVDAECQTVDWGGYHGDFKPENILLSEKGIYGIDFILAAESYQLMDLAQFANHLLFLGISKTGYRVLGIRHKLIDAFIQSYAEKRGNVPVRTLVWLRVEHLLRYYLAEHRKKTALSMMQSWFIGYEIKKLMSICNSNVD